MAVVGMLKTLPNILFLSNLQSYSQNSAESFNFTSLNATAKLGKESGTLRRLATIRIIFLSVQVSLKSHGKSSSINITTLLSWQLNNTETREKQRELGRTDTKTSCDCTKVCRISQISAKVHLTFFYERDHGIVTFFCNVFDWLNNELGKGSKWKKKKVRKISRGGGVIFHNFFKMI